MSEIMKSPEGVKSDVLERVSIFSLHVAPVTIVTGTSHMSHYVSKPFNICDCVQVLYDDHIIS